MQELFSRNFGIELEFSEKTNREFLYWNLSKICPEDTILIVDWQKNIDNKEWICKTDSSCGYEVSSPVFKGIKDLVKVKNVIDFLKSNGAQTSKKCAVHVHVECKDFNAYKLSRIISHWIKYEGIIFNMFPKYRRESSYCMPLNNNLRNWYTRSQKHTPRQFISLNSKKRNHSLNTKDYKKRGTIEFRLLEGLLNSHDIICWIIFCLYFTEKFSIKPFPENLNIIMNFNKFWSGLDFDKEIDPSLHYMKKWILKRLCKHSYSNELKNNALKKLQDFD